MRNTLYTLICCFATLHAFSNGLEKRLDDNHFKKVIPYYNHSILILQKDGSAALYDGSSVVKRGNEKIVYVDHEFIIFSQENNLMLKRINDKNATIIAKGFSLTNLHNIARKNENIFVAHSNDLHKIDLETSSNKIIIENNLYNSSNIVCAEECVLALGNLLLNPLNISEVMYESEYPIDEIDVHQKQGVLFLSNSALWIYKNNEAKRILPAQGKVPTQAIDLKNSDRYLYLLTDHEVHVFDWISSSIERVGVFNGEYKHSITDHWGNLWITTSNGLWNYTPPEVKTKSYFSIEEIIDNQSTSYSLDNINLDQNVNHLSILSKFIYLPNKKEVETEWSLDGNIWKKYDEEIIIPASMFSVGENELLLRATINQTSIHPIGKKIKISRSKKTSGLLAWILFPILALMTLISLLSLQSSRKEKAAMQAEIEKIRAKAELVQSEIKNDQLKMNPHFLFNALASVNGLIAQQKIPEARTAINSFSKFLREFLYSSDANQISLESECSLLANYLNIEKICRANTFDFEVEKIEDELLLDTPIPNMVLQPFVENAIIHGVSKVSYPGHIKVYFTVEDSFLVAHVEDNGAGFAKAETKLNHKSMAINLIKKRLQKLDIGSRKEYVQYEDLNPGTRVKIYLKRI